jgi:hypothetical protein
VNQSKTKRMLLTVTALGLLLAPEVRLSAEERAHMQDPAFVVQAYLRATYARDFTEAYRYISSEDRRIRDLNRYVQQRGAFNGFALEAARTLADFIEIRFIQKQAVSDRMQTVASYRVPDPAKISSLLLNWDPYRLNLLPVNDRNRIIETIEKRKRDGSLDMIEGEDKFELVKESDEWRIFLNWAAGIKIPLRLEVAHAAGLDVALSTSEVVVQPGDLFELTLKIKNRSKQPVTVRIGHLVQPTEIADYLDFLQCGFLLPLTLQPGKAEDYSSTYMLRASIPEGVRRLTLSYDVRLAK